LTISQLPTNGQASFQFNRFRSVKEHAMGLLERREKEKSSRRRKILDSARTLFFAEGFKNVTVDKIAEFSELGKGSIYLYFNSKEEIYAQILLHDIEKFNQQASVLFSPGKSSSVLLDEFSRFYANFFLNDPELFRILMTFMLQPDQMNLSEKLNPQIMSANASSVDSIGRILLAGIQSNEFSAEINLKNIQFAIWGMLNGIISLHIFSGSEKRRRKRIRSTIKSTLEVFIKGLSGR
jgi:AcrR family transcriptional regulator